MDFTDAVVFAGAIVAIVGSGIVLGVVIGRGRRTAQPVPNPQKATLYSQLLAVLDGLRAADDRHKQRFIELYYAVVVHGSDQVVRSLNAYLQNATATDDTFDSSILAASRDQVALAMRQDLQAEHGWNTALSPQELYSIEISHGAPAMKPESQVDAPYPTPANVESDLLPDPAPMPEPRPAPRGY